MKQQQRFLCMFLCSCIPIAAVGASPKVSRGVTADGRVIVARYGTPPPWGADIVKEVRPQMSTKDRAQRHEGEGLFRVILDPATGAVRRVTVEESSGYPGIDESVVHALRQWRLRPRKWKEFEIHVGLWLHAHGSNQSLQPTAGRRDE